MTCHREFCCGSPPFSGRVANLSKNRVSGIHPTLESILASGVKDLHHITTRAPKQGLSNEADLFLLDKDSLAIYFAV